MALERLAGPFPVSDPAGTPIDIAEAMFYPTAIYDDVIGLASFMSDGGVHSLFCITQMDGITYPRSAGQNTNNFVLDLQATPDWLVTSGLFKEAIYAFDPRAGVVGGLVISGAIASMADVQARAVDRWLSFTNSNVQSRPLDFATAFATEFTLAGAGSGRANLSRTRRANILCLTWPTGEVLFYDHLARAQVAGAAFVGANNGAWYSPRHDVFVVLTGTATNQVSVFANSVRPTAISAPVAAPALAKGRGSVISVYLRGANNDPAAGEMVDWTLAGPGSLLAPQSLTDADGIARVGYVAPLALSTNPTFTATVTL